MAAEPHERNIGSTVPAVPPPPKQPPPPEKSDKIQLSHRRRWPWVVGLLVGLGSAGAMGAVAAVAIVIAFILLLLAIGVFLLFALILVLTGPISHGPAFVNALAEGENRVAYGLMCESSRSEMTFWEFQKQIALSAPVASVEVETEGAGFDHAPPITHARFHFSDGTIVERTYEAVPSPEAEHGDLYVCAPSPFNE